MKPADASSSVWVPGVALLGIVTLQLAVACWPGATAADDTGEVAVTVQPFGALRPNRRSRTAWSPVLLKVSVAVIVVSGFTTVGASRPSASCTTIGVVPVTPSTVTRIVATPGARMVTVPLPLTVATRGSLLAYVTWLRDRSAKDWSLLAASMMLSALAWFCSSDGSVSGAIHGLLPFRLRVWPVVKTTWSGCTVTDCTRGVIAPRTVTRPAPTVSDASVATRNW